MADPTDTARDHDAPQSRTQQRAQLRTRALESPALGRTVEYGAYIPAHRPDETLPLLFLLHGAEASYIDFTLHMHELLQQLAQHHRMIVVLPEGAKDGWYLDSPNLPRHRYALHVLDEVVPDAERWLPSNARRSIAGISAGGNGAIVSALHRPELFRGMSALSGALDLAVASQRPALTRALGAYESCPDLWQRWSARHVLARDPTLSRRLPLLLTVGSEDIWAKVNRQVSAELRAHCVPHQFHEEPGGHTWEHWATVLPRHLAFHARLLVSAHP